MMMRREMIMERILLVIDTIIAIITEIILTKELKGSNEGYKHKFWFINRKYSTLKSELLYAIKY